MHETAHLRRRQLIAAFALLLITVVIVGSMKLAAKKSVSSSATALNTPTAAVASSTAQTQSASGTYKDGTYTATGTYDSPDGTESITINVMLQNSVITSTSAQSGATDNEGREYQADFIGAYKSQVVGKSISSLSLSRVAGASLTTQGFNDAIKQIEAKAQQA